jgi:hypothetical protein
MPGKGAIIACGDGKLYGPDPADASLIPKAVGQNLLCESDFFGSSFNGAGLEFSIVYPVYLIPHGGGYLSLVDPDSPGEQLLVVCTLQEEAMKLISQFEILAMPKSLSNDREFSWLLQSVKYPVIGVAFDPKPYNQQINASFVKSVAELLDEHLKPDRSPWNYPVFTIAEPDGFACIEGSDVDGSSLMAICVFTTSERANEYVESSDGDGTPCMLQDLTQARDFFGQIDESYAVAVAIDPVIEDNRAEAKYCFSIRTLMDKYLVQVK